MPQVSITISVVALVAALIGAALAAGLAVFILSTLKLQKLATLAAIDDLTQLYNSREFRRRLTGEVERAKRYGKPLSLVLLDVDHFKEVNDSYGYTGGDAVLRQLVQFIRARVRAADVIFRYKQGDEFAILALETPPLGAAAVAERLRSELANHEFQTNARPNQPANNSIALTLSAGIAGFDPSSDTSKTFIERAERALEKAKKTTNCVGVEV